MEETPQERQRRLARERSAAWRADNPERARQLAERSRARRGERWDEFLAQERERYRRNRDKRLAGFKAAKEADPERFRRYQRTSFQRNPARVVANTAKRRALRIRATPAWADLAAIRLIYADARRITKATDIPHEVDHIVPLNGRNVCGLHVPWNLRIITRRGNREKGNALDAGAGGGPRLSTATAV